MMDWTDRHCRAFHRQLTAHALLYTEMVTADAVIHGDQERLLGFDPQEHPLALQLGGSDPQKLAAAARIGELRGYDEINLNCGCPSERVQSGSFGACLMREPALVADCVRAMRAAVEAPVTVKCRIGVDDDDSRESLFRFVESVAKEGCDTFVIHARKAWLSGLSPKENRNIPPLDYDLVAELKRHRPDLNICLNGGLDDLESGLEQITRFDGVMYGRRAYQSPFLLGAVDRLYFKTATEDVSPLAAALAYRPYIVEQLERGVPLHAMTRHMLGLFSGLPGARRWRRRLSENAPGAVGAGAIRVFDEALEAVTCV